jgi:FkbM family methyltransferase
MDTGKPQYVQGIIRFPLENGETLEVTPLECWRLIEEARCYLLDNYYKFDAPPARVVHANKKCFSVSITKNVDFWNLVENGHWEPNTFRIFDDLISADHCYVDIGAWIGPTALYAAQLAKRAYAFEPDPIAYQELESNARINRNTEWGSRLTISNKAIAPNGGPLKIGNRSGGGNSESSVLFSDEAVSWEVEGISLEQLIEAERLRNEKLFIKMDIEGGEYELIPKTTKVLSRHTVDLFLSIHPPFLMDHLIHGKRNRLRTTMRRRLIAVWHQIKLTRSLPFTYLYHSNGRRVNLYIEVLKALVLGRFLTEIVATNRRWTRA